MTIFDDIRKDREAGTPGDWNSEIIGEAWKGGQQSLMNRHPSLTVAIVAGLYDGTVECDSNRIARVPQLEAIALAAEDLVDALEALEQGDDSTDGTAGDIARGAINKFEEACK